MLPSTACRAARLERCVRSLSRKVAFRTTVCAASTPLYLAPRLAALKLAGPAATYATKVSRTSSQFTFSTKYPRQKPSSKKGNSTRTSKRVGANQPDSKMRKRLPKLALPPRLRLAQFNRPQGQEGSEKDAGVAGGKGRQASGRSGPQRKRREGDPEAQSRPSGRLVRQRLTSAEALANREAMEQKRARHAAKFELSTESELDQSERRSMAHMKRLLNFDSLGLRADVAETATSKLGYKRPTTVQALCIPEILNNDQDGPILCAAETGGGKTGAYLLPIIHTLKQQEEDAVRAVAESESALDIVEAMTTDGQAFSATAGLSQIRKLRRPRAVIVVPSRELVMQVTETAKTMCHSVRLRVVGAHAGITKSDMEAKIVNAPVDLLVATPGSLNFLLTKEGFAFSQTRLLVIDEADTMTDEDFGPDLERILRLSEEQRTKQHQRCQTVFVSATVPVSLIRTLERHFPTYRRIATPSVHRTVPGLTQRFVRIENGTVKQTMLLDILKRAVLMDDRIIIFCNTRKSCEAVTNLLRSKEYDVQDISSNVHVSFRAKALKRFAAAVDPLASLKEVENVERQTINRVPIILVATDIASRGLDTVNVGHVILYDFPQTAIDYLHRVGRTARNGRSGRATSIVAKKDMALADSIESSIRGRMSLA